VNVARVDPRNEVEFLEWFDVLHRADLDRSQGRSEGWLADEWRARSEDETAATHHQLFSLRVEEHVVAIGALEVSRDDNLTWIRGDLFVDPPQRRKGYGSILLRYLETRARELGRSALLFWVTEDEHERSRGPNRFFAPRREYVAVEENIVRELDWPRPPGELDRLEATWSVEAAQYVVLSWRGAAQKEHVSGLAQLKTVMPIEVPDSGFGREEERWDERRVRQHERLADSMGRDLLVAIARQRSDGEVVGFSELTVSRERPKTAYQWDTLVRRDHRGHSLGGLLKIATMRLLSEGGYRTTTIKTSNNTLNMAMIAVNESLGAHPTGGIVVWRKVLRG